MSQIMKKKTKGWRLISWLFKLFGFPIIIPWLMYQLYDMICQKIRKKMLHGKVVVITGASSGLGEALAHVFYKVGCKLVLISRRKEELERVKNNLMRSYFTTPIYPPVILPIDITDITSLQIEVAKIIDIYEKIDILINNAGIAYRGEIINTNMDVNIKIMLTNYFAQIGLTKAVLPYMIRQQSGHIVCVSSLQGKISIPFRSAYAASKYALQAWCDCCRAELHKKKVKVTVISPGYIRTSFSLNALTESGQIYGVMDKTTQEGYDPRYVADCILEAVLREKKDVLISPFIPKLVVYIRTLCPSLYFWIMQRQFEKAKTS